MHTYHDSLQSLNQNIPLREKLIHIHRAVMLHLEFVARIAIALYDPKTTVLKSYLHSGGEPDDAAQYQSHLQDAPSLAAILREGRPRVINNLLTFEDGKTAQLQRIGRQGYAASYTLPMFSNGVFFGFIFFNSHQCDVFTESVLNQLDIFGHMISLMVVNELSNMRSLLGAISTVPQPHKTSDPETGSHWDRMSRYSRLIALTLAPRYQLNDNYVDHIFMYSPLHDIGEIGIPDHILLKPATLTDQELLVMRSHTERGRVMIDDLLASFGLDALQHVNILRNIAEFHHEAINGRGYPRGLKGKEIPLEARIVAVADVFDALTSRRSYKDAWTNDDAFATLQRLAGEKLDNECVSALMTNRKEIDAIQTRYKEAVLG
ncbi:MAG: HD domain-containing protein [Gammaproteobacteria bacterium]|nr:HD domain-containing protein [Gammaproteobacteria bacterium]